MTTTKSQTSFLTVIPHLPIELHEPGAGKGRRQVRGKIDQRDDGGDTHGAGLVLGFVGDVEEGAVALDEGAGAGGVGLGEGLQGEGVGEEVFVVPKLEDFEDLGVGTLLGGSGARTAESRKRGVGWNGRLGTLTMSQVSSKG